MHRRISLAAVGMNVVWETTVTRWFDAVELLVD